MFDIGNLAFCLRAGFENRVDGPELGGQNGIQIWLKNASLAVGIRDLGVRFIPWPSGGAGR